MPLNDNTELFNKYKLIIMIDIVMQNLIEF